MPQGSPLIAILVIGFGLAFVFGTIANRMRISPLVGYLVAGVAIGPYTPGFVGDAALASQLADIGVILLMFGVGLHFSFKNIVARWALIVPGAVTQIAVTTTLGLGVALFLGWSVGVGLVFGLALGITSTVALTRSLEDRHLVDSERGHIAIGWLIVQDMIVVMALVLLPPLAAALDAGVSDPSGHIELGALLGSLGATFINLVAFIALMLIVGRRVVPWMLHYTAHTGSRELFRLAVLVVALGVAYLAAEIFGVSLALGAFFAGVILSESELSQRAAEESLPMRDAFAVLFFVSIGMLFDPFVLLREPGPILATMLVVLMGNGVIAFLIVRGRGHSLGTALTVGVGLAQIGEFSFVLADLGIGLGLLDPRARDLILGTSILSIMLNPLLFAAAGWARRTIAPPAPQPGAAGVPAVDVEDAGEEFKPTDLRDHAILVGYGRVGRLLAATLMREGWPLLVIENATDIVERLRTEGIEVLAGNAADGRVLAAANLPEAKVLLVAIPNGFEAGQIVEQAREANPDIRIIARAHFDAEVDHLLEHGTDAVIMGEREIARAMLKHARGPELAGKLPSGDPPAGLPEDNTSADS